MKTILVDAVDTLVSETGEIFTELHELLEQFPNPKIVLTNAADDKFERYGLNRLPYPVFTLQHNPHKVDPKYFQILLEHFSFTTDDVVYFEHNPEAVTSAQSVGITSYYYDPEQKDLDALRAFLSNHL